MVHIIAVCNQKGGVGKTTTAISLSACLAAAEKRTLLIDMDPQGNSGSGVGLNKYEIARSIYHVLIGREQMLSVVRETEIPYLSICPSNTDLVGAELELVGVVSRETRLKSGLVSVSNSYDFIVIDCPPSLGLLTLNALTACHYVLIPVQAEYYAMEGIADLHRTIQLVRTLLNPTLSVLGVIITMFDPRNNLSHQVSSELRAHYEGHVFDTVIPRNVRLSEAPSHGKPIILYDIKSPGALRYIEFTQEVLNRIDRRHDQLVATPHVEEVIHHRTEAPVKPPAESNREERVNLCNSERS